MVGMEAEPTLGANSRCLCFAQVLEITEVLTVVTNLDLREPRSRIHRPTNSNDTRCVSAAEAEIACVFGLRYQSKIADSVVFVIVVYVINFHTGLDVANVQ